MRKALVVAGLSGLLILTACGKKDGDTAASSAGGSSAGATPAAQADPSKLGPFGYGGINLGDSAAKVKAAGLEVSDSSYPCLISADAEGPNGKGSLLISAKDGVYLITAYGTVATPEGIKLGSTLAEVKKAYPAMVNVVGDPATDDETTRVVVVPGNPNAKYNVIMKDGKVDQLSLRLKDCTN